MEFRKVLTDESPCVFINGKRYHLGKDPRSGSYFVEHERDPMDYWEFENEAELSAFVAGLPMSLSSHQMHGDC